MPLDELFRILYGIVSAGQLIERGDLAEQMADEAGQAAHRLEKPPVADQVHVVLWVIKANDIRFVNDQYMDKFDFVRQKLNKEGKGLSLNIAQIKSTFKGWFTPF